MDWWKRIFISILGSQRLDHLDGEAVFGKPRAGISRPPASDNIFLVFHNVLSDDIVGRESDGNGVSMGEQSCKKIVNKN